MRISGKLKPFAALLSVAILTACATPTPPVDTSILSFKAIGYSLRDTCQTQREIAAHNSVYDTLRSGRQKVYTAPCDKGRRPEGTGDKTS
jgi:hypothetical protein